MCVVQLWPMQGIKGTERKILTNDGIFRTSLSHELTPSDSKEGNAKPVHAAQLSPGRNSTDYFVFLWVRKKIWYVIQSPPLCLSPSAPSCVYTNLGLLQSVTIPRLTISKPASPTRRTRAPPTARQRSLLLRKPRPLPRLRLTPKRPLRRAISCMMICCI